MPIIETKNLSYQYAVGSTTAAAVKNLSLVIEEGEFTAIVGKSGSGKSTLFHLLGCLLKPTSGQIFLGDQDVSNLEDHAIAHVRNREIGFVFQQFHLLPRASVLQNVLLPTLYTELSTDKAEWERRANAILDLLGLKDKKNSHPNQLSGGEQQRVAIARALLMEPKLILADEPTGNLDTANSEMVFQTLKDLNRQGKTVVVITHDSELSKRFSRVIRLQDGLVIEDSGKHEGRSAAIHTERFRPPQKMRLNFDFIAKLLPQAMQNLMRNKIRAMLTMIGVVVGVAAVFAMLTFGQFAQEKVMKGYQELGVNTVMMHVESNWRRKATDSITTTYEGLEQEKDFAPLIKLFPEIEKISPHMMHWEQTINYGGKTVEKDAQVLGVSDGFLHITNRKLIQGRPMSAFHVESASAVCLIGTEVVDRLFKGINPLEKILFLTDRDGSAYPCHVIGVMEAISTNKDWRRPNLEVVLPYTYFQKTSKQSWDRMIHTVMIKFKPSTDPERSGKAIKSYFIQRYGKAVQVFLGSDAALVAQMKKALLLFTLLLASIATITLTVGGIGINNMMLVSVTERFKEIGLRKAVGATNDVIRTQFLLESLVMSAIAGLVGVLIGFISYELVIFIAAKLVNKMQFEWVFEPVPFLLALVSIVAVGIASGIVPALKAEKLQVIEALRSE